MRYIANSNGYIQEVSFGAIVSCNGTACTEYTGSVPAPYSTMTAWFKAEADKLYQWKVVDGELVRDANAAAPASRGNTIRCFGSLTEVGITSFPTTMKAVAAAMPANSMIIIDSKVIDGTGTYSTEAISDWGMTMFGVAIIAKAADTYRVSMQIFGGQSGSSRTYFAVGSWIAARDEVQWLNYSDNDVLYSGSFSSGSITFRLGLYRQFIIVGKTAGSNSLISITVPREAITTTDTSWQLADNQYFFSFYLKYSGDTVTLTYNSKSTAATGGEITGVYGVI